MSPRDPGTDAAADGAVRGDSLRCECGGRRAGLSIDPGAGTSSSREGDDVDVAEREARAAAAKEVAEWLREQDVVAVATTFVDNSGIARVKCVPLDRLAHLAAWGVGISTSFDRFRFDDWIAADPDGRAPVGDLRIIPDVRRVVPLAAQPGWAWAPGGPLRPGGSRARPVQSPAVAAPGRRARGRRDHHQGRLRDRVGDQPRAHRRLRRRHPRSRLWHEPRDRRQRLCGRRAPGTGRPGRRRRAVPSRVRTRAARDLGRRGVPGRGRGHLGPGPGDDPRQSGRVTASGRRTPPRSRSPESATAGTCT